MGPIREKPMNMQTIARPPATCLPLEVEQTCIGVEFSWNRHGVERDRDEVSTNSGKKELLTKRNLLCIYICTCMWYKMVKIVIYIFFILKLIEGNIFQRGFRLLYFWCYLLFLNDIINLLESSVYGTSLFNNCHVSVNASVICKLNTV